MRLDEFFKGAEEFFRGLIAKQTPGVTKASSMPIQSTGYSMPRAILHRTGGDQDGVRGRLRFRGMDLATLEKPWRDNATSVSCIPAGLYRFTLEPSPRFGRPLYRAVNVPGRSAILIHPANLERELEGCIALGVAEGVFGGTKGILRSREAVDLFMQSLGGSDFDLEIINPPGGLV